VEAGEIGEVTRIGFEVLVKGVQGLASGVGSASRQMVEQLPQVRLEHPRHGLHRGKLAANGLGIPLFEEPLGCTV
jgi:hypothetical protein